ncbi:MauE/DoxX family redox-associated membrane protein [Plantactinospora siamensis]|uniref:MauE/DoxX family redox-associated membrane protein n=1 Tax=Plantactinospora siamensis TaxID=555372 RepID=A0ABV6P3W8_9ACTN
MRYLEVACRILIGVVFFVSATSKLRSRAELRAFGDSLPDFLPLPAALIGPLSLTVALLECAVVPLVLLPVTAPVGCVVAFVLLAGFTVAVASTLRAGRRIACRCFGPAREPLGPRHLLRNGVLLAAAAGGLPLGAGGAQPVGLVVAGATGLVAALILIHLDDILGLFLGQAVNPNPPK